MMQAGHAGPDAIVVLIACFPICLIVLHKPTLVFYFVN